VKQRRSVGVGDYGYVLDCAMAFSEVFGNANGSWALSSDATA
jgi:hypothetical protein